MSKYHTPPVNPPNLEDPRSSWLFNLIPHLKGKSQEEIKEYVSQHTFPYAVLMSHILGDFNLSSLVRSANAMGAEKVFYYGKRKYDRRGACGTYHYTPVHYLESSEELLKLKQEYSLVAFETQIGIPLHQFDWVTEKKPLIILGEGMSRIRPRGIRFG